MALFGEDTGSLHGSTLFGTDPDERNTHDPWSTPAQGMSAATKVSRLLSDSLVPEVYSIAFQNANPTAGEVDASALTNVLKSAELSDPQIDNIFAIISQGAAKPTKLDRGTWNVAFALAGFAQRGSEDLNLDLVDFARDCKFVPYL